MYNVISVRLENTLNYGLERVWAVGYIKSSRRVVIGYDEGTIMVKLGREVPVASMDNGGKIIWAKHNEIQTVNIKSVGAGYEIVDGERLPLAVKELGTCDLYPQCGSFLGITSYTTELGKLDIAKEIATEAQSESKWKQLGDLAMSSEDEPMRYLDWK